MTDIYQGFLINNNNNNCRPTFCRIYKKKSTESFQSLPYQVALFSCMLWLYYALIKKGAFLLITINAFGCVVETIYISMFLAYASRDSRVSTSLSIYYLIIKNNYSHGIYVWKLTDVGYETFCINEPGALLFHSHPHALSAEKLDSHPSSWLDLCCHLCIRLCSTLEHYGE